MASVYLFEIDPVPASRPRVSRWGTYYLPTYRKFKDAMSEIIAAKRKQYIKEEGTLAVNIMFGCSKPKSTKRSHPHGDIDNYVKAALDSLNGVLWDDDDQIIELAARKFFITGRPYIVVEVIPAAVTDDPEAEVPKVRKQRKGSKRRQSRRV